MLHSEPHLAGWEDRLFEAINQLDRFLTNLEPVIKNSNYQSDFTLRNLKLNPKLKPTLTLLLILTMKKLSNTLKLIFI